MYIYHIAECHTFIIIYFLIAQWMINLLFYTSESVSYPQITAFHNVIIFTECLEYNRVNNKNNSEQQK